MRFGKTFFAFYLKVCGWSLLMHQVQSKFQSWVPVTRLHFCWSYGSACAHRWSASVFFFLSARLPFVLFFLSEQIRIFLLSGKLFLCVLCLFFYARDLFLSVLARAVVSSFHRHLYCLLLGTYFCCVFDWKLWIEPWWGCMHRNMFCLFSANLLEVHCLCFKYRFRFFVRFDFGFFLFPPIFLVCIGPDSFIQPFVNSSNREGFGEVGAWMYVCGVCVCMYVFVCGRPTFGSGAEAALLRNNSFSRLK